MSKDSSSCFADCHLLESVAEGLGMYVACNEMIEALMIGYGLPMQTTIQEIVVWSFRFVVQLSTPL